MEGNNIKQSKLIFLSLSLPRFLSLSLYIYKRISCIHILYYVYVSFNLITDIETIFLFNEVGAAVGHIKRIDWTIQSQ